MNNTIKSWFKLVSGVLKTKVPWDIDIQDKAISNVDVQGFNLATITEPTEGQMNWNSEDGAMQIGMPGGNVKLQIGQEELLPRRCQNNSGVDIKNGNLIYISGGSGVNAEITLADNSVIAKADATIAMATEDIDNGSSGWCATFGLVRGTALQPIDTSSGIAGTKLYLSTAGTFTVTKPVAPSRVIELGTVFRNHATEGSVLLNIHPQKLDMVTQITREPTGFTLPENVISTYDSTARTITLTGTVNAYYQGNPVEVLTTGWVSDPHPVTLDTGYFLLYDGTNFVWQTTPWTLDTVQIAFVWYGTNEKFALREVHGLMQWQTHYQEHNNTGTWRDDGAALGDYVLNSTTAADRRPSISEGLLRDEDLPSTIPTWVAGTYTTMYLIGTATNTFNTAATDIVPLSGNQPYWNELNGGTYQQTLLGNNNYMCLYVATAPATADAESQLIRQIFIQGQKEHPTLLEAQGELPVNLDLGNFRNLFTEFALTSKIILRYTASNWTIVEVTPLTGSRENLGGALAGVYLADVTTDSTLTGDGTTGSPLSVSETYERSLDVWSGELNLATGTNLFDRDLQKGDKLRTCIPADMTGTYRLTRAYINVEDLDTGTGNNPNNVRVLVTKNGVSVSDSETIIASGAGLQVTNMLTNLTAGTTWTAGDYIGLQIGTVAAGSNAVPNIEFDIKFEV